MITRKGVHALIMGAFAGVTLAPACANAEDAQVERMQRQIDALQRQLQSLQKQVNESKKTTREAPTQTAHVPAAPGSARQSRLSLLVEGNLDPTRKLAGYYEMDFLGAGVTSNYNPKQQLGASVTPRLFYL